MALGPINKQPSSITLAAACKFKLSVDSSVLSVSRLSGMSVSVSPTQPRAAGSGRINLREPLFSLSSVYQEGAFLAAG